LKTYGIAIDNGEEIGERLNEIRRQYEPYLNALAQRFLITLPLWIIKDEIADNWRTSAWERPVEEMS
jgi:hypothetical protein